MESQVSARPADYPRPTSSSSIGNEANASGVSWSAVIAGGFVAAALALILLALGTGLGLSSVSFWSNTGASASSIGKAAIAWLILMEIMSSSMGGWLAGRLRTKWASIHTDEVYFRDTAHGFLAWCVALVVSAAFLGSAATSMVGSSMSSGDRPGAVMSSQSEGSEFAPDAYFVDSLFRSNRGKSENGSDVSTRREAGIILTTALQHGELSPSDKTYLAGIVANDTGLSQSDADNRVANVFASAKQAAETARKATAHALLWIFLALLIGAFCASFSATIGGRQRDRVVTI
jgi:hypothetical protein